jgi:hypothetical protein
MMNQDNSLCATNFGDINKLNRLNGRKSSRRSVAAAAKKAALKKAALETLETRTLMSASVTLSGGILDIAGDANRAGDLTATLVNNGKSIYASAGEGHTLTVASSAVKKIVVTGGTGNDTISLDTNLVLPTTISGGSGNDVIWGSGGRNDIIEGNGSDWINIRGRNSYVQAGNGNDTIYTSSGSDTVSAGNGNDSIFGQSGDVIITAGNGRDTINSGSGSDKITVGTGVSLINLGTGQNTVTVANKSTKITGTTRLDTIQVAGSSSSTSSPQTSTTPPSSTSTSTSPSNTVAPPTANPTPAPVVSSSNATYSGAFGSNAWSSYAAPTTSTGGVRAVLQIMAPAPTVGIGIVVRALNSTLGAGSPIDANYQWNFGDTGSAFNTLTGFNAAHIYNTPGTYPITLTVTNYLHQTSSVTVNIKISPDTRKVIYVDSVNGSDNNNGLSPNSAVKSAARASQMVGNNTEILFHRGEEFNSYAAFKLNYTNVLVGAYGTGALPIINYQTLSVGSVIFTTNSWSAVGVTVSDVALTTLNGNIPSGKPEPMGVMAGGFDTAVVGCTFYAVEYDINGSSGPVGLTAMDNSSPISGDMLGYFLWDQGTDTTVLGNYANGSVNEHVLRTSGANELLIADNTFNNYDGKGCIEMHVGGYAWIDGNTCNGGDIRVGPLGLWGEPIDATVDCVIQNNTVNSSDIQVYSGAQHISIRNNIITRAGQQLIDVIGQDGNGRQSADIRILNNTGVDTASTGNFVKVENHVDGILLENNLLIAPTMAVGGYNTAPVYAAEGNLSSFTFINANVWQEPIFDAWARGGINFVGSSYISSGYQTPEQWNSYSNVGTDYFSVTPLVSGTYIPQGGSLASYVASPVAGVFTDIYGIARSTTGSWTAGAI